MALTVDAVTTAGTGKSKPAGVRVTEGVLRQVAAKGPGQACIAVRGSELDSYRGDVVVSLDGATYRLTKTDTHACWATRQGENLGDFVTLFNILEETPNKVRGSVEPVA